MSEFAVVPSDMTAASGAAEDAAVDARAADGSDALALLAGALPGSAIADLSGDLATAWTDGLDTWSTGAEDFAESVDATSRDGAATDASVAGGLTDIMGPLGGPR